MSEYGIRVNVSERWVLRASGSETDLGETTYLGFDEYPVLIPPSMLWEATIFPNREAALAKVAELSTADEMVTPYATALKPVRINQVVLVAEG